MRPVSQLFHAFCAAFDCAKRSSPFEEGVDTGLASIRPTITESLPIAGMPYNFKNWQEYVNLCRAMYRAGSIERLKDLWWDVRSCPQYGTLEIRICDQPASMAEVLALVAFVHALAFWFQKNQSWLAEMPRLRTHGCSAKTSGAPCAMA
jgi:glutamate---cysteine ligase / carboxylate-amine ligase